MKVILSSRAEKELEHIPKISQIAVTQKIRLLRENQVFPQEEKLAGFQNIYRVRVGNYRIVYKRTYQQLYIVVISHRKQVYRMLWQLLK